MDCDSGVANWALRRLASLSVTMRSCYAIWARYACSGVAEYGIMGNENGWRWTACCGCMSRGALRYWSSNGNLLSAR